MGINTRKMFQIGDGLFSVGLEDVWSLKLHERVIPDFIITLKESLLKEKAVRDPVVVDERTLVVLDGMHRVVALRELGYSHIPCCFIDYMLPAIQLGAWYRLITGSKSAMELVKVTRASFHNLRLTEANSDNVDKMVNKGKAIGAFCTSKSAWLINAAKKSNRREAYDLIYSIEEKLRADNAKITYQTEFDAKTTILNDKSTTSLMVPTLTKEDVLHFALRGEVFAPKATRHVFPLRILSMNVPLELLDGERHKLDEADQKLQASLSKRKLVRLPGGQIIEGRRYEEPICMFG